MKIGYRGWAVRSVDGVPTLSSPHQSFYWQPGENIATTKKLSEDNHLGFYALKTPEGVFEYFYSECSPDTPIFIDVIGEVLLYGDVVDGEKGYRAEKAQVGTLLLPTISRISMVLLTSMCLRYQIHVSVTTGHTRQVLERYRNAKSKERIAQRYGKPGRRCTAGGRAIAEVRRDGFLL